MPEIPTTPEKRLRVARQVVEAVPHAKALGMTLKAIGDNQATMAMPYDPQLIGDPETGVIHGGAVSALMDMTCGLAVMAMSEGLSSTATLDLRIDYMRSATPGQTIVATAECHHRTRTIAFVRASAVDDDTGNPVATATGAFTVNLAKGS